VELIASGFINVLPNDGITKFLKSVMARLNSLFEAEQIT
jgi:hypothetical protein